MNNGKLCEPVYKLVGAKIEYVRNALGMTQADLAKKAGYTRTSITNIEAGRQRLQLHQVEKFAQVFGITVGHLMKGIWS